MSPPVGSLIRRSSSRRSSVRRSSRAASGAGAGLATGDGKGREGEIGNIAHSEDGELQHSWYATWQTPTPMCLSIFTLANHEPFRRTPGHVQRYLTGCDLYNTLNRSVCDGSGFVVRKGPDYSRYHATTTSQCHTYNIHIHASTPNSTSKISRIARSLTLHSALAIVAAKPLQMCMSTNKQIRRNKLKESSKPSLFRLVATSLNPLTLPTPPGKPKSKHL